MRSRLWSGVLFLVVAFTACTTPTVDQELAPELESGHETYSSVCATCHGGNGQGGSAPALDGVTEAFGKCADQIEWITLGSERWKSEVGATYGDDDREITAVMPEFGGSLTPEEIARVAAYERVRFGGVTETEAIADCDL